jgi:hypothetical protein
LQTIITIDREGLLPGAMQLRGQKWLRGSKLEIEIWRVNKIWQAKGIIGQGCLTWRDI